MFSAIHHFKWTWLNSRWSASIFVTLQRRVALLQNHLWMTLLFKVSSQLPVLEIHLGLFRHTWSQALCAVIPTCYRHCCITVLIRLKKKKKQPTHIKKSLSSEFKNFWLCWITHEVLSENYLAHKCNTITTVCTIFNSSALSLSPLSRVAKAIYQLCTNIFKGPTQQHVSRTLGVAVVHDWIQLFSRRPKQPECFW